ncbi:MAG: glycosyltransferase family 2 protein [Candidatus Omnitrophica bacterium]|nr:glycosyltransferase family 2 protein [Candidatus Omnitrophota bacterium]
MINGKKIIVVLPAYNAEKTIERTYREIPREIVDEVILVDDKSSDSTIVKSRELGITTIAHEKNLGYGGNQKTCYKEALKRGADIVVMLHPDYQYPPKLVSAMAAMITYGEFDAVLGSRILAGYALKGGMPIYKYISNRLLTFFQNIFTGNKLSEYHTGYRAYSRGVLTSILFEKNSDDFIFDNQILLQIFNRNFKIGELSAPCNYNTDCSSINLKRSIEYGLGIIFNTAKYLLHKNHLAKFAFLEEKNE